MTELPIGLIGGSFNHAIAHLLALLSDTRVVESVSTQPTFSVIEPRSVEVILLEGPGLRQEWIDVCAGWDTVNLEAHITDFRQRIFVRRTYCDPFEVIASSISMLLDFFTLAEFAAVYSLRLRSGKRVYEQVYREGHAEAGAWRVTEEGPSVRIRIEMGPRFFPNEIFCKDKINDLRSMAKESIVSIAESAIREQILSMSAAGRWHDDVGVHGYRDAR